MAIIQVPYTVRVWAFADTESGEVVKVVEDLESLALDTDAQMLDEDYDPVPWDGDAGEIATLSDWPAWDR